MVREALDRWRQLGSFDRLGGWLVAWEVLSLGAGAVLLPLALDERIPFRVLIYLAANAIGLATALTSWVLTHLLLDRRRKEEPGETVHEFVTRRVEVYRSR